MTFVKYVAKKCNLVLQELRVVIGLQKQSINTRHVEGG